MSENILSLPTPRSYDVAALAEMLWADSDRRQESRDSGVPLGPRTGLGGLDDALSGHMEPGIYTLNGTPGSGKTAMALQISDTCGFPAIYLSCEMGPLEIMRRLVARVSHRSIRNLRTLHGDEVKAAIAAARDLLNPEFHLLDATSTQWSPSELRTAVLVRLGPSPHGVLVIDSLHAWAMGVAGGDTTQYDALNQAVECLKSISKDYGIPVIQIAERNRASMRDGGLHSSAGSGRIEYASDVYLDLRKSEEQQVAGGAYLAQDITLVLEKNRFGPAPTRVLTKFDGRHQRFSEP